MLKPLMKNVVVKLGEVEETTQSGFVLPTSAQERQQFGEVLAVGPDVKDKDGLAVGDQVVVRKHAGSVVEVDEEEYLIIDLKDILAVVA